MSFSFLTDRGYEGYAYDYGVHDDWTAPSR